MRKILSIVHYEYRMQIRRRAAWGVFLAALAISLADNFPSAGNLARLEFLSQPEYFIHRIIGQDGLLMVFGLLFLLSDRIAADEKSGLKTVLMATPLGKGRYVAGKMIGALGFTLTMFCAFLLTDTLVYVVALPGGVSACEMAACVCRAAIVSVLPISIFVSFSAVAFPVFMDIRLFYLLAGMLFVLNVVHINSAGASPFYLITSGDLLRLIWVHPRWPQIDHASVRANLAFLLVSGAGAWLLPVLKRGFWRAE